MPSIAHLLYSAKVEKLQNEINKLNYEKHRKFELYENNYNNSTTKKQEIKITNQIKKEQTELNEKINKLIVEKLETENKISKIQIEEIQQKTEIKEFEESLKRELENEENLNELFGEEEKPKKKTKFYIEKSNDENTPKLKYFYKNQINEDDKFELGELQQIIKLYNDFYDKYKFKIDTKEKLFKNKYYNNILKKLKEIKTNLKFQCMPKDISYMEITYTKKYGLKQEDEKNIFQLFFNKFVNPKLKKYFIETTE